MLAVNTRLKYVLTLAFLCLFTFATPPPIHAAAPEGSLDRADNHLIAGWARDPDYTGSIMVHIYVDDTFVQSVLANQSRPDVGGNYGFRWQPPAFGPGDHLVRVYAIGVNASGSPNSQNPELSNSPKTLNQPRYFTIANPDNTVSVQIDSQLGGIISHIYDQDNLPGKNQLVTHGGAGLQFAFWLLPRHEEVPPGCDPNDPGMWYENPTQGGYYSNLGAGNPIGIKGTQEGAFDSNEFIRYEGNGQTVHLKSRFIDHSYCLSPEASLENQELWDTDYYIEQWLTFNTGFTNSLKITSNISHIGTSQSTMDTRHLIAFTNQLSRVAWQENGQLIINTQMPERDLFPDNNWMAALDPSNNSGFGFVIHPNAEPFLYPNLYNGPLKYSHGPLQNNRLAIGRNGHVKLQTLGTINNVSISNDEARYTFLPNGSFSYTTYLPIGQINQLRTIANQISNNGFSGAPPPPPGDHTQDGQVDINDYWEVVTKFISFPYSVYDLNLTIANINQ